MRHGLRQAFLSSERRTRDQRPRLEAPNRPRRHRPSFERIEGDGYFTLDSEWIVPTLLGAVPIKGRVLEPAAGRGHISLELKRAGPIVESFDIQAYEKSARPRHRAR